jgi:hypothetical protein
MCNVIQQAVSLSHESWHDLHHRVVVSMSLVITQKLTPRRGVYMFVHAVIKRRLLGVTVGVAS